MRIASISMLRRFIVTWFFNIVALWVAAELIDGIGYSGNEWVVVLAALVFSLVNIFVKPLVILFTLPLVILTLGLALFFVNLLMLYLTSWIVDDFKVESFGAAILATIIVWVVNTVLEAVFARVETRASSATPFDRLPVGLPLPCGAMRPPTALRATLVAALAVIALAAGCGGGDDDKGAAPATCARTGPTWRS